MGNQRRFYKHGDTCLVTNRLAQGLPFVPNAYINALVYGAVARACALNPGIAVCAFEFLQNHFHFVVYIESDAKEMASWLHDLDDELARIVKTLLGKSNLKVWAQRPHVAVLGDAGAVIRELSYVFLNSVEANFCKDASDWIGVNSYRFLFSPNAEQHKWVRTCKLNQLPNKGFTARDIKRLHARWLKQSGKIFTLVVKPYIWKKMFKQVRELTDEQVRELILEEIARGEAQCGRDRRSSRRLLAEPEELSRQNPYKHYTPSKRGRRVYCICTDPELRQQFIELYKAFCETCVAVWQAWKRGDFSQKYPPGAFLPPRTPLASALAEFQ